MPSSPFVWAAAAVLALGYLTPGQPVGAAVTGTPHRAVISFGLPVPPAGAGSKRFRDERTGPMVRLEVVSSRDEAAAVRRLGGHVRADVPGWVLAASLPAGAIDALARRPGVTALFPSRRLTVEDDQGVTDIRAAAAWAQHDASGLPVQGEHVLIGTVDGGIDYHSADFKNADGTTRIKALWDQTISGHAPQGFDFGYECDSASINDGSCPERDDTDGHGTHVLGIAAGNGRSTVPATELGVAPQADILSVKSDLTTDDVIAAWTWLIRTAQRLREPIVINNSFGDQDGPHDGTEPEDQALDRLSGPGRIFVKSAGNAGHEGDHASGTVRQGQTVSLAFAPTEYSAEFDFEVFYPARDSLAFSVRDLATNETFGPVSGSARLKNKQSKDHDTRVTVESAVYNSSYREAYVDVRSASDRRLRAAFRLQVRGIKVAGGGRFDAWMQGSGDGAFAHANESDTMTIPGDARSVITVGNYATSTSWRDMNNQLHTVCDNYACLNGVLHVGDISASSSAGPTADGRHKPDISAPGTMITSTLTRDAPVCAADQYDNCIDPAQITPDGRHLTYTGTSMAAPHVTGTIALMLQINPTLNPAQADSVLTTTARHDAFTGTVRWSRAFGAGKLDAGAAVRKVATGSHG